MKYKDHIIEVRFSESAYWVTVTGPYVFAGPVSKTKPLFFKKARIDRVINKFKKQIDLCESYK
jgi:hypothetical protein